MTAKQTNRPEDTVNFELRSAFSLISLAMIGGFIGVRASELGDNWYLAPIITVTIWLLAVLYLGLRQYERGSLKDTVWLFFIGSLSVLAMSTLTQSLWLSIGTIAGWISCSLFFQIRGLK